MIKLKSTINLDGISKFEDAVRGSPHYELTAMITHDGDSLSEGKYKTYLKKAEAEAWVVCEGDKVTLSRD